MGFFDFEDCCNVLNVDSICR